MTCLVKVASTSPLALLDMDPRTEFFLNHRPQNHKSEDGPVANKEPSLDPALNHWPSPWPLTTKCSELSSCKHYKTLTVFTQSPHSTAISCSAHKGSSALENLLSNLSWAQPRKPHSDKALSGSPQRSLLRPVHEGQALTARLVQLPTDLIQRLLPALDPSGTAELDLRAADISQNTFSRKAQAAIVTIHVEPPWRVQGQYEVIKVVGESSAVRQFDARK